MWPTFVSLVAWGCFEFLVGGSPAADFITSAYIVWKEILPHYSMKWLYFRSLYCLCQTQSLSLKLTKTSQLVDVTLVSTNWGTYSTSKKRLGERPLLIEIWSVPNFFFSFWHRSEKWSVQNTHQINIWHATTIICSFRVQSTALKWLHDALLPLSNTVMSHIFLFFRLWTTLPTHQISNFATTMME